MRKIILLVLLFCNLCHGQIYRSNKDTKIDSNILTTQYRIDTIKENRALINHTHDLNYLQDSLNRKLNIKDSNIMYVTPELLKDSLKNFRNNLSTIIIEGEGEIDLSSYVTNTELQQQLNTKADAEHTHSITDLIGLQDTIQQVRNIAKTGATDSLQSLRNQVNQKLNTTDTTNRWQPIGDYLTTGFFNQALEAFDSSLIGLSGIMDSVRVVDSKLNDKLNIIDTTNKWQPIGNYLVQSDLEEYVTRPELIDSLNNLNIGGDNKLDSNVFVTKNKLDSTIEKLSREVFDYEWEFIREGEATIMDYGDYIMVWDNNMSWLFPFYRYRGPVKIVYDDGSEDRTQVVATTLPEGYMVLAGTLSKTGTHNIKTYKQRSDRFDLLQALDNKSDLGHTHIVTEVTGLRDSLQQVRTLANNKASTTGVSGYTFFDDMYARTTTLYFNNGLLSSKTISPSIVAYPNVVDFGNIGNGTSTTKVLRLYNPGTDLGDLIIYDVYFIGIVNNSGAFSFNNPNNVPTFQNPLTLPANGTVDITLKFSTTINGVFDSYLVIGFLNETSEYTGLKQIHVMGVKGTAATMSRSSAWVLVDEISTTDIDSFDNNVIKLPKGSLYKEGSYIKLQIGDEEYVSVINSISETVDTTTIFLENNTDYSYSSFKQNSIDHIGLKRVEEYKNTLQKEKIKISNGLIKNNPIDIGRGEEDTEEEGEDIPEEEEDIPEEDDPPNVEEDITIKVYLNIHDMFEMLLDRIKVLESRF